MSLPVRASILSTVNSENQLSHSRVCQLEVIKNETKIYGGEIMDTGYCMKCKKHQGMKEVIKKILGGRMQVKGKCKVCGTNMSVFAKK